MRDKHWNVQLVVSLTLSDITKKGRHIAGKKRDMYLNKPVLIQVSDGLIWFILFS